MSNWGPIEELVDRSDLWTRFIYREELDSTSRFLRNWDDLETGVIVLAEKQTSGRGKGTRKWYSPEGGLWFSFTLGDSISQNIQEFYVEVLNLITNLLEDYGVSAQISRPNDLVVEGDKIAGMLIEQKAGNYIVGIGMNVNNDISDLPELVKDRSTTMKEVTGKEFDRARLLGDFLSKFEDYYSTRNS